MIILALSGGCDLQCFLGEQWRVKLLFQLQLIPVEIPDYNMSNMVRCNLATFLFSISSSQEPSKTLTAHEPNPHWLRNLFWFFLCSYHPGISQQYHIIIFISSIFIYFFVLHLFLTVKVMPLLQRLPFVRTSSIKILDYRALFNPITFIRFHGGSDTLNKKLVWPWQMELRKC